MVKSGGETRPGARGCGPCSALTQHLVSARRRCGPCKVLDNNIKVGGGCCQMPRREQQQQAQHSAPPRSTSLHFASCRPAHSPTPSCSASRRRTRARSLSRRWTPRSTQRWPTRTASRSFPRSSSSGTASRCCPGAGRRCVWGRLPSAACCGLWSRMFCWQIQPPDLHRQPSLLCAP